MKIDYNVGKALLEKGINLQDQDLINMALSLLGIDIEEVNGTIVAEEPPKAAVKTVRRPRVAKKATPKKPVTAKKAGTAKGKNLVQQFTRTKDPAKVKYVPVQGGVNKWVDEGVDCKTEDDKTPAYKPAPRQREAASKIIRTCGESLTGEKREDEGCGAEIEINPKLAPDFFLCDECLEGKRKGR